MTTTRLDVGQIVRAFTACAVTALLVGLTWADAWRAPAPKEVACEEMVAGECEVAAPHLQRGRT